MVQVIGAYDSVRYLTFGVYFSKGLGQISTSSRYNQFKRNMKELRVQHSQRGNEITTVMRKDLSTIQLITRSLPK